jgi:hypothetical protein
VGAPLVHGKSGLTFIGEYFGFDASSLGFTMRWTDTRTGMQELFSATLVVEKGYRVERDLGGIIFGGVDMGGGGWIVLPNGKIKKVPPHEPAIDILRLLDVYESAKGIEDHAEQTSVQCEALKSIERIVQRALHR